MARLFFVLPGNVVTPRPAVRPGRIQLVDDNTGSSIAGVINKATYVGSHMEYRVSTDHGVLFVLSDDVDQLYKQGSHVGVSFAKNGPVLLPVS